MRGFQAVDLPINFSYGIACAIIVTIIVLKWPRGPNLDAIPAVGSSSWCGSWWAGLKFLTSAQKIIQHGYEKYKSAPFKVAEPNRWTVILSSHAHVEELAKASDEEFSFLDAMNDQIQIEHTLGHVIHSHPYHVLVIRNHLTRNLEVLYPEIRDEIVTSFAEVLDLKENEWRQVPALSLVEKILCRTNNRVFVGLPLCRNPDWIDLNIQFAMDVITGGVMVGLFPKFMRSFAARFLTRVPRCITRGVKFLGPVIEERRKLLREYGTKWDEKPNDLLSWLMDEAEGPELSAESLTRRMLVSHFTAIHTSANSFAQMLLYLAANPQYIQPLREEVEGVVEKDGWSKAALGKMSKIDSFLRECQRMEGIVVASLARKARKDFTFSDGTFIPKGTTVSVASMSLHHDAKFYENPDVFEPFRFALTCDDDADGKGPKHQYASTSPEYLAFGHGRHACPGRFFAASELKLMLAHVVVTYDVKLEDNGACPVSWQIASFVTANPRAKVMLRNRV